MNQQSYDDEVCYGPRRLRFFTWRRLIIFSIWLVWTVSFCDKQHPYHICYVLGTIVGSFVVYGTRILIRFFNPNSPSLILNFKGMHYQNQFGKIFEARWDSLSSFMCVPSGRLFTPDDIVATVIGEKTTENLKQGKKIKLLVRLLEANQQSLVVELNYRRKKYLDYKVQKFQKFQKFQNTQYSGVKTNEPRVTR